MSEGNPEYTRLLAEFEAVTKRLDDVLKDIEWRKPDVEGEEAKLAALREQAKTDPDVDVASQVIIVRVLREVLDEKMAEANRLEARMVEIQGILEKVSLVKSGEREVGESGQAVREEAKRVG